MEMISALLMMTSSNGNIFRVTDHFDVILMGHLWEESTWPRWFSLGKGHICHWCVPLTKSMYCWASMILHDSLSGLVWWISVEFPMIWGSMALVRRHCNEMCNIAGFLSLTMIYSNFSWDIIIPNFWTTFHWHLVASLVNIASIKS